MVEPRIKYRFHITLINYNLSKPAHLAGRTGGLPAALRRVSSAGTALSLVASSPAVLLGVSTSPCLTVSLFCAQHSRLSSTTQYITLRSRHVCVYVAAMCELQECVCASLSEYTQTVRIHTCISYLCMYSSATKCVYNIR